jgi:hypothetical protein
MKTSLERTKPLYRQISTQLEAKILGGDWAAGDQLPTTEELATMFGVTVQTAQQGAALLTRRGVIERIRGRGTFVSNRISSRTIGIVFGANVFGSPDALFYQSLYGLICRELKRLHWNAGLYFPSDDKAPEQMLAELGQDVESGKLRGLIPLCISVPMGVWLGEHPHIPIGSGESGATSTDDPRCDEAYRGVAYLLDRGYRRIAVVMHTEMTFPEAVERTKARVAQAYADRALPPQATFYEGVAASHGAGVLQARAALADPAGPPDAFLVLNDQGCMGVIFELMRRKLDIPSHIGVMALANKGIEIPCPVPLTRLEHDPADFTRRIVEATLASIEGREAKQSPINDELVIGESCGEGRGT